LEWLLRFAVRNSTGIIRWGKAVAAKLVSHGTPITRRTGSGPGICPWDADSYRTENSRFPALCQAFTLGIPGGQFGLAGYSSSLGSFVKPMKDRDDGSESKSTNNSFDDYRQHGRILTAAVKNPIDGDSL